MTELSFNKGVRWYESDPISVSGDFALHIEFNETADNEIQVLRSATGENYALGWRSPYTAPVLDRSFVGAVEGLSIVVRTKNEPRLAVVIP